MGPDPMLEIPDRPALALGAMLVVALAVYVGFQLAFDGQVNLLESGTFAVVFAAVMAGLSWLRGRSRD